MSNPREAPHPSLAGLRRMLFVAFAACTLWLLVENLILLLLLPHWWPAVHAVTVAAQALTAVAP